MRQTPYAASFAVAASLALGACNEGPVDTHRSENGAAEAAAVSPGEEAANASAAAGGKPPLPLDRPAGEDAAGNKFADDPGMVDPIRIPAPADERSE